MDTFGTGATQSERNECGVLNSNLNHFDDFMEKFPADPAYIGAIIGRGGCKIKEIRTNFNVYIHINNDTKEISVKGRNRKNVDDAVKYIRDIMSGQENRNFSFPNHEVSHNPKVVLKENTMNRFNASSENDNIQVAAPKSGESGGIRLNAPTKNVYNGGAENHVVLQPIDWETLNRKVEEHRRLHWAHLPDLRKNFYEEVEEVAIKTEEEVNEMRYLNNNISVSRLVTNEDQMCPDIPKPIWKFQHCFKDYPDILDELKKQNFNEPSPIQKQAWPILLRGEDMIGIAQTGTGKTLAFLLPALIHTDGQTTPREKRNGPNILILAPTRELALQIAKEVNKYSFRGIKAVCIYGGGNRRDQISVFKEGAECVICTPGRLNDLVQAKVIDITSVTYLILDEADRMLDMGFEPQIRKILLDIRPDRQTVMTSATWPPSVGRLAESYMNNPIQVCVGSLDLTATHTVSQNVELLEDADKFNTVLAFLKNLKSTDKVIIFCSKRARADDLSSDLSLKGLSTQCIHGSRDQTDREQALADIASGDIQVLIATDVASRGLDIEDITHVINFDFPRNIEEYVHRVGRTGRAGRTGTAISYITRSDWGVAKDLIRILEEAGQAAPEELYRMSNRFDKMKERRGTDFKRGGGFNRRY
ncbi:probable ATP-dependent RNA helicase DDX43 [Teleopsis dalmanni]|uniref:probable ATP-dependent RNA helicase DDX43 n=1 Tax=Teleopsis dalmanni TaxID=139649 RepID=UPI0018CE817A|nr:probable ATP-dependent RNA helicase DDX43 [Teleopsis dalmanni]XP_037928690.1 probable ATP-dependent RNA helicase DDX43 [Teleopsis dalmanni]XP_037951288.1 probable ATP-dependent RNA helicase DDX43 [Teleopsis dalmanni]